MCVNTLEVVKCRRSFSAVAKGMQRVSLAFKAKPKHRRVTHLMAQTHQNIDLLPSQADIDALADALCLGGGVCGGAAPALPSGAPPPPPPPHPLHPQGDSPVGPCPPGHRGLG